MLTLIEQPTLCVEMSINMKQKAHERSWLNIAVKTSLVYSKMMH
jgi:hypothetical protein